MKLITTNNRRIKLNRYVRKHKREPKRITDIHVLWGQSTVIEELIQVGKINEEYIYPFNGDEVGMVACYSVNILND